MLSRIPFRAQVLAFITIIFTCTSLYAASSPAKKTVLITGGLSGIGRDIATEFKNAGWNVWVTSREPQKRDQLAGVTSRQLNITDETAIRNLMNEIKAKDKRLDVLVNNAGYAVLGPTETVSAEQARNVMEVNVIGPFLLMQEALPLMRANHGGHIISISSTSGLRALPGLGIYAASKMALEGLCEAVAAEVAQWNIQVAIIEPGTVKNDWVKNVIMAENIHKFPGYKSFTNKLQTKLSNKAIDVGQESQEIAQLALKIANTPKPDLRYQTNTTVSALAHEVLVDPTGNKMREQTISLSNELFDNKF